MAKYKKIPVTIEAYTFDEMKDLEEKYGAAFCNESRLSSFEINGRKIEQINTDTCRIKKIELNKICYNHKKYIKNIV